MAAQVDVYSNQKPPQSEHNQFGNYGATEDNRKRAAFPRENKSGLAEGLGKLLGDHDGRKNAST